MDREDDLDQDDYLDRDRDQGVDENRNSRPSRMDREDDLDRDDHPDMDRDRNEVRDRSGGDFEDDRRRWDTRDRDTYGNPEFDSESDWDFDSDFDSEDRSYEEDFDYGPERMAGKHGGRRPYGQDLEIESQRPYGWDQERGRGLGADRNGDRLENDWRGTEDGGRNGYDDFYAHEEGPEISGQNNPRRPRRPVDRQQAYEQEYYDDMGRGPDSSRRSRAPQPRPNGRSSAGPGQRPAPPQQRQYQRYEYPPMQPAPGYEAWPVAPEPEYYAPGPSAMDLNLVSSLVRWASIAKHRVGEQRLSDIVELYIQSRDAPPGLKEALLHITSIVDDQAPQAGQTTQETLDLIAHLHGILTATVPVPEVPNLRGALTFQNRPRTDEPKGDW